MPTSPVSQACEARVMRTIWAGSFMIGIVTTACADPARFQPAQGASDLSSVDEAIRVAARGPSCDAIGTVVDAKTIDAIAITAARHGGTHFRVTSDFEGAVVGNETVIGQNLGVAHSQSVK